MSFLARFKFLIGLLLVVAIVASLFMYLNYTMSNISSQRATLETDSYAVSTEYDGALRRMFVDTGDKVEEGDPLFEISSPSLTQAVRNDQAEDSSPLYEVADNGNMILLATAPGIVQQINYSNGAYIEVGGEIATVATDNARYVIAHYLLSAPDYSRINRENLVQVTLPDNSKYEAKVFDISLEQENEQVYTVVRARLPKDANILPTFASGTPVSTSWQLDNSDWQNSLIKFIRALIEPQTQGE